MIDPFFRRLREPSTWAGVGTLALAFGQFSDNNKETAQAIAQTAEAAQTAAIASGDWLQPAMVAAFGLAAIFAPERKR